MWPGRISFGGITVLDSAFDIEKRLLAFDLAARVSTGRAMPDGPSGLEAPGHVVLLTHSRSSHTVRAGLEAPGTDMSRVTHPLCKDDDWLPAADLEAVATSSPDDTRLFVVDPLVSPVASFPTPKRAGAALAALVRLAELADRTGAAILLLRDLNVGSDPDPWSSGSSILEILGVARSRLIVVRTRDDKHGMMLVNTLPNPDPGVASRLFSLAGHDGRLPLVVWSDPGVTWTAASPAQADADVARKSAVEVAGRSLVDWLTAGPLPAKVVEQRAAEAGIAMPTLLRAKSRCNVTSSKRGGPGGKQAWWWSLPPR